jgi:hypothetical protein
MASDKARPMASSPVTSSANLLAKARERSRLRKELIKSTLGVKDLSKALGCKSSHHDQHESKRKKSEGEGGASGDRDSAVTTSSSAEDQQDQEESEFRDSTAFLKGTQSLNPHNDYSQHFVDTGQRPQNFIRDVGLADRFEEYPKLRELIKLKNEVSFIVS